MAYIANTDADRNEMLETIGVKTFNELISNIPEDLKLKNNLNISESLSEFEVQAKLEKMSSKNVSDLVSFAGAGVYDHYIPAVISSLLGRSEFYTAYTPYQAEVSQGTLQAIYEFQSMICALTGMDVANASMYDGATALAEAMMLACTHTKKKKFVVAGSLHPHYKKVLETYAYGQNIEIIYSVSKDGSIDFDELQKNVNSTIAGVAIQQPNFYGIIEDVYEVEKIAHAAKAMFIVDVDVISLGILEAPGNYGADIVVGEAHVLGNPQNYGGPYLGIFAVKNELIRKIPGRLAGITVDVDNERGFVLTLQTREQQIKREKATSNICSNQGLCMLAATIYMSLLGKQGIKEVAELITKKAHYLSSVITNNSNVELKYNKPFFREFVLDIPVDSKQLIDDLVESGILAGVDLARFYEGDKGLLVAVTEKRTKDEMDNFAKVLLKACSFK